MFVQFKDINSGRRFGFMDGNQVEGTSLTSVSNRVEMIFYSDGIETRPGFNLSFIETDMGTFLCVYLAS